jgi:hypothetical protein
MKLKELTKQLQEYEKIYGPTMEVICRSEFDEDGFRNDKDLMVDGIDYLGEGQILIVTRRNED